MLEDKIAAEEKLAISEYELRLAQEDLEKLQSELKRMAESPAVIESDGLFYRFKQSYVHVVVMPLSYRRENCSFSSIGL